MDVRLIRKNIMSMSINTSAEHAKLSVRKINIKENDIIIKNT